MFDILTAAAVADELSATILDGRIQKIGLVNRRTIAAEVYAGGERHALVASAEDRNPRVHLAPTLPSLDTELVTPFGLLLRKYLRGGIIIGIEQPPLERLVRLSIAKRLASDHDRRSRRKGASLPAPARPDEAMDEDTDPFADLETGEEWGADIVYVHLAVEIMGRHSNLILIDDEGSIMEAAKRVTLAMSRVRPIAPRLPYTPPPPIAKPDPRKLTTTGAAHLLALLPPATPLAKALVSSLRGFSPQMAREIAYRTTGTHEPSVGAVLDTPDGSATLARETRGLLEPLLTSAWSPRLYRTPGQSAEDDAALTHEAEETVAYAAVPMNHLADSLVEEPAPTISAAIALVDGESGEERSELRHTQRRARLVAMIGSARQKQERRLASVRTQGETAASADTLRRWGELLYANLWQIAPGQSVIDCEGEQVDILPGLSAKATAQEYFERYRKAQSAGVHHQELEAEIATELAYLDQLSTLAAQATRFAEIEGILAEWETHAGRAGGTTVRRKQATPKRPRPLLDDEGNAVFVGRTAVQNDLVTFELVGPDDTWLHARGTAGSHVVIRWRVARAEERQETIVAAARLAAWYSAARGATTVDVDIARRRHVRKIKGGRAGLVTYRHERTIAIQPGDERVVAAVLRLPDDRSP